MTPLDRRRFLKYCIGSAAALGLDRAVLGRLEQAFAAPLDGLPTVLWLAGSNCTGCTVSLANLVADEGPADVGDLLINTLNLAYHPNLMGAAGDLAVQTLTQASTGDYVLAVEGGIPTAFGGNACMLWTENGHDVTAMEAVSLLAPGALAVLAIGSCASFGGIPAGEPNPTGVTSVGALTGQSVINIPGCPTHPDWIVWTIAQLLAGSPPALDQYGRPAALFSDRVHDNCPLRHTDEAEAFGVPGRCLEELGCRGKETRADCPSRRWHGQSSWCIGVGSQCVGCVEPGFPDSFSPFHSEGEDDRSRFGDDR
jgi:hydrogenase small subunit